jgi:asparagine synthase (glutamine-hydrolysing)
MCGIFAVLGKSSRSFEDLEKASNNGSRRGPEFSVLKDLNKRATYSERMEIFGYLGFHRLAINGLNVKSNQPLIEEGIEVICNGEIYNYKEIFQELRETPSTDSDCEAIIYIYKKYGIDAVFDMIDGVYAFVLIDHEKGLGYVARDPYGVRPLFQSKDGESFVFASEMKQLVDVSDSEIQQFTPGTYSEYSLGQTTTFNRSVRFSSFPYMTRMEIPYPSEYTIYKYIGQISQRLKNAVSKRVTTTDRPIACLLSGGLDSSLITALVAEHFEDKSKLETYSIGLEGSEDLKYAQMVADHLGTKHTSIIVKEQDFLDAIPEVIYAIESYDTTTVRASVGNFLVAKYIKEHSEAKVIFNGDGSDEFSGGYLYFHACPNPRDFDLECKRLLRNIHYFDVLRSDRCISYHGLEARTPFLDRSLIEHYLTIPMELRDHAASKNCEKYILRSCFSDKQLLPHNVMWRTKEAFSDGVSSMKKSWYETIQENVALNINDELDYSTEGMVNPPKTPEQKYYRKIFEQHFSGRGNVIPYFWMPRFTQAVDSSARTLKIYESLVKK